MHTTCMIIVGVCGGIAAYKTCELVRTLVGAGHEVQVIQTPESRRFVGPTTFAALSRRPVLTDDADAVFPHLDASAAAELLCIAPLTATTMARLAHGEASNVLTATALAFRRRGGGGARDEPAHVDGGRDPANLDDAACSAAWSSSGRAR